jgi:ribonuclease G
VIESQSRGEFATRRGGRRRRRPSKNKPPQAQAEVDGNQVEATNGQDEDFEPAQFVEPQEEVAPPSPEPPQRQRRDQRDGRDQRGEPREQRGEQRGELRGQRDQRSFRGQSRRERHQPAITDLLSEGQEILVQIAKEPIAKKGARITSHIAMPGRFLVYMPTVEHVGVSRKIESDNERHRLRKLIQTIRAEEDIPSGGFIVRTAGVGISEKELREDVRYLVRTWLDIRSSAEKSKAPALVHRDLDLVQRLLRDQLSDDFESIRVDSEDEYQAIVEFINRIQPRLVKRVKLYTKEQPILEAYGVQAEIDKAIKPRVWLKSGGYLVINQTEALVAIDVNTGKFVGRGSGRLEDTITRTNLEAVDEIVRQIRLRDLGGIIVLDLIDMEERRNRQKVMQALQEALRNDKSPTKVLSFNDFGLVIMTRKRVKQSLERTLCSPCSYCQGAGLVKSPQTICYELLEDARRLAKEFNGDKDNKQVTLRINPDVAKALRSSERDVMIEIEDYLGPIDITSDPTIHQEQFDFAVT